MKLKHFLPVTVLCLSIILISWGYNGHRIIGQLTAYHLNDRAKIEIKNLLGDTSIADACTWADDARKEEPFKETANWHFLNLPLGLTFEEFKKHIDTISKGNVYSALVKAQNDLTNEDTPKQQKIYALKFIMHFVGDIHQPMHVARAEDKGGNTIQLNFKDKGTNLHSLWDTKILEQQNLTYTELANKYNNLPDSLIKQWQSAPIIEWAWESYQISSQLYTEVNAMGNRSIDDSYVQKHLPTIERRIQQAAIRLAGILNKAYPES